MSISVAQVSREFGSTVALAPSSLEINDGELIGLLGPSGSGKTTLLRIIAGLETPSAGRIAFNGKEVTRLHPRLRRVGFVFQNYALFRHMTVFDNIAFGLRAQRHQRKLSKGEIRQRVTALLEQVQLTPFAKRLPAQLSGGQQQRVALARALAVEPEVLLMDEPFGALDAKVRIELRRWLRQLHHELGFTCVFVTHDQEEALELADRVAVMSQGQIEQIATPTELYRHPANRFVFNFLGTTNHLAGEVQHGRLNLGSDAYLALPGLADGTIELLARPHDIALLNAPTEHAHLPVTISNVSPVGGVVDVELSAEWLDTPWQLSLSPHASEQLRLSPGDQHYVVPRRLARITGQGGELEEWVIDQQA